MFGPPIGDVKLYMILKNLKVYPFLTLVVWVCRWIGAPIVMARSVHQYIGAPMSPSANRQCRPGTVSQ